MTNYIRLDDIPMNVLIWGVLPQYFTFRFHITRQHLESLDIKHFYGKRAKTLYNL